MRIKAYVWCIYTTRYCNACTHWWLLQRMGWHACILLSGIMLPTAWNLQQLLCYELPWHALHNCTCHPNHIECHLSFESLVILSFHDFVEGGRGHKWIRLTLAEPAFCSVKAMQRQQPAAWWEQKGPLGAFLQLCRELPDKKHST